MYPARSETPVDARNACNYSPLLVAAEYGSVDVVDALLQEEEVSVRAVDIGDKNVLHLAVENDQEEVVKVRGWVEAVIQESNKRHKNSMEKNKREKKKKYMQRTLPLRVPEK